MTIKTRNRIRLFLLAVFSLMLSTMALGAITIPTSVQEIYQRFPLIFTPGVPGLEAHRGLCDSYPENTIPAFEAAAQDASIQAIETDIQRTSDGYFVCMHDNALDRTTSGTGTIASKTLEELSALTITGGSGWSEQYAGQLSVPTLEEFLDICRKNGKVPYLELKVLTEEDIKDLIQYLDDTGWAKRAVIISFSLSHLKLVAELSSKYPLEYMPSGSETYQESIAKIKDIPNMAYRPSYGILTAEAVTAAREAGLLVECYGLPVGNEAKRQEMVALGVDGITCDSSLGLTLTEWAVPDTDIGSLELTISQNSFVYSGTSPAPEITMMEGSYVLEPETEYTVSLPEAVNVGTYEITITGSGRFSGSRTETFEILPKDISGFSYTVSPTSFLYNGSPNTPSVVLSDEAPLLLDADYQVAYGRSDAVGTVPLTITGIGNYTGTIETSYEILPINIESLSPVLGYRSITETGQALRPTVSLDYEALHLVPGTDFSVEYRSNQLPGTATVTITGLGNYTGTLTASFEILEDMQPYYLKVAGLGALGFLLLLLLVTLLARHRRRRKRRRQRRRQEG